MLRKVIEKKQLLKKLRVKYRLVFFNEQTYEELLRLRLSRLQAFMVAGAFAFLLIIFVTILIAFTPLKEYIPGYPDAKQRRQIVQNATRIDSLVLEIKRRDHFFYSIKAIMEGQEPETFAEASKQTIDSLKNKNDIKFKKSKEDSLFRQSIELEEKYNISSKPEKKSSSALERMNLFCPLKGFVVNKFGETQGHWGVDIVATPGSRISSIADGTVIFDGWTVETGYVIQIQHDNNLVTIYKHNSSLLKETGMKVKAGEAIANAGNSGELTTGPHLHFEMWYNGTPINPEEHINFD